MRLLVTSHVKKTKKENKKEKKCGQNSDSAENKENNNIMRMRTELKGEYFLENCAICQW